MKESRREQIEERHGQTDRQTLMKGVCIVSLFLTLHTITQSHAISSILSQASDTTRLLLLLLLYHIHLTVPIRLFARTPRSHVAS